MKHAAFTINYDGRCREIITKIAVRIPSKNDLATDPATEVDALWDTGATNSVVTKSTAAALGLVPINSTKMNHANGQSEVNVYLIDIILPNGVYVPSIPVMECDDAAGGGKLGAIIGMDIISVGDFSFTNMGGVSKVSFRTPSLHHIDYVNDPIVNEKKKPIVAKPKPGRNETCPCGSGSKYKNCHGKNK